MSAFLTPTEVQELTGYLRASDQVRWCTEQGLQAWLNARGQCVVPRDLRPRGPAQPLNLGLPPVRIQENW